jgi:hypothetical protein
MRHLDKSKSEKNNWKEHVKPNVSNKKKKRFKEERRKKYKIFIVII